MNKFKKIISALAVSICFMMGLASCSETSFYQEWHEAGATIEEDNCFKVLTAEEVSTKREAQESFCVFLGSSDVEKARTTVSNIQAQAEAVNYDGKVYFVNTKEALATISAAQALREKLSVNELNDSNGLVCVCYIKGNVYFDTSDTKKYNDRLQRFIIEEGGTVVDFNAIANYVFDNYKVVE